MNNRPSIAMPKSEDSRDQGQMQFPGRAGWRTWIWTLGVATGVVLLVTILWYINALREGGTPNWGRLLLKVGCEWYPWALFTPLVAYLIRKYPLDRSHLWSSGLLHLGVAVVLSVVQNSSAAIGALVPRPDPITMARFSNEFVPYFLWMAPWSVVIYFGIVSVLSAVDYRSRFLEREWLASKLESELTRAQLHTLYAQLQPHFLFNTLNSISVLMSTERGAEAQTMLHRLSDLLRYVLARGDTQEVSVEDELSFVRQYLSIEQTRFADRLAFHFDVEPGTLAARVPTFLLQTLVENAVRHGLTPKVPGGELTVRISDDNGKLSICVEDNGVGVKSGVLDSPTNGVGLANARSRLRHLYGDDFLFELAPRAGGGTVAKVLLPLRKTSERSQS